MDKNMLVACELEALHLSGAILGHGTLLVVDQSGKISHVAANIADWLGASPQTWLGQPLPIALSEPLQALAMTSGSRLALENVMMAPAQTGKRALDLVASRNQEKSITLELLPSRSPGFDTDADSVCPPLLTSFSDSPTDSLAIAAAQDELVQSIMKITGFQRVMLYRFREDGDGEVIAESRQGGIYGSYLGLRFPATDIPLIARMLYLKNPWRLIPDATRDPVPLLSLDGHVPDLTYSDLRSVSKVHRVYLANMGVTASLSFPIVSGGALIALVACHHNAPRQPALQALNRASRLAVDFGLAMSASLAHKRIRLIDGLAHRFDSVHFLLQRHGDLLSAWPEMGPLLMRDFAADGATLCLDDTCANLGECFEPATLSVIDEWFCNSQNEFIWFGESLRRQVEDYPLSEIAGVLALRIRLRNHQRLRLYLTRIECIHEVAWGGNPEKPVEFHDGIFGIAPRTSFERWVEQRLGFSRGWDNETRLLAFKLRELLLNQ